jgi:ectoine hydroxylase-related dioxygenase (phytanoyl-CoA dioxygenase family)
MSAFSACLDFIRPGRHRMTDVKSTAEGPIDDAAASLRRELALLFAERERERAQFEERIADLTRRLDHETEDRRRLMSVLAGLREQPMALPPQPRPAVSPQDKLFFETHGYLILEGFFEPARIERLNRRIDELWAERGPDCPLVIDCLDTGDRTYFREVDEEIRRLPYKLNDVHLVDEVVRDFSIDGRLAAVVAELMSATPVVCNTLLLERSTQQNAHFDTFFMPSPTPNMMCASWIAIDPVDDANGPLFYYPKSHLIEPYRFSSGSLSAVGSEMPAAEAYIGRIIEEYGLQEARFYPKPGDVLIWHAQLLHGGSPILDPQATRKSLVTHYWTTRDYPDPADWIVVGEGRYLLSKAHQPAISEWDRIDEFIRGLSTPPEYLADLPAGFDPHNYLLRNMDVFRTGMDPHVHYHLYGRKQGRGW